MSIYKDLLSKSRDTLEFLGFLDAPSREPQRNTMEDPTLIYNLPHSEQDFDGLFSMCPNLELIQLPIGVHIPQNTANKIAEGVLLPSLKFVEVSSTIGVDILDMVKRRNELAYRCTGWIGSSKLDSGKTSTTIYPPFFSALVLHTSAENRSKVKLAQRYLQSSSTSQETVVDIRYGN